MNNRSANAWTANNLMWIPWKLNDAYSLLLRSLLFRSLRFIKKYPSRLHALTNDQSGSSHWIRHQSPYPNDRRVVKPWSAFTDKAAFGRWKLSLKPMLSDIAATFGLHKPVVKSGVWDGGPNRTHPRTRPSRPGHWGWDIWYVELHYLGSEPACMLL